MKKVLIGVGVYFLFLFGTATFATNTNTELEERENEITADELKFTTFESCQEMENVLETYIKDNFGSYWQHGSIRHMKSGVPIPSVMPAELDMIAFEESSADQGGSIGISENSFGTVGSSTTDFSTTNLQVQGVDEADILKVDQDTFYFYNAKESVINLLSSPLDVSSSTINLDDLKNISNIKIPERFSGIQLYLQEKHLIIVANRRRNHHGQGSFLNTNSKVDVIVYDVSTPSNPKLIKVTEIDGNYHDSRRIGDKLYIISQLRVDRFRPSQNWKSEEDIDFSSINILPKNIDIAYTTEIDQQNLLVGKDTFPYHVSINKPDCSSIQYILPTKSSIERFGLHPSFTVVNTIDLSEFESKPGISTAFGQTNTIHMSKENLYLTQNMYLPEESTWSCPENATCVFPSTRGGQHTLIHKFGIESKNTAYKVSTLIQGSPLSQYSMDEDSTGKFRILTKKNHPELATDLYILDDNLDVYGSLTNIEPGEEFKSSRYIGDKLYLVTFEQIDPLFAIDLADSSQPTILGELKIPGFSTYLHPYGPLENGVQYLLGLGYNTQINERGGTIQSGIKLDLYEIDYTKKNEKGEISIKQIHTKTWGENGSQSEALYNPRMFVWDQQKKNVVLPMHIQSTTGNEICEVELNDEGEEIARRCEPSGRNETTFSGMKTIQVTPEGGIKEIYSSDYRERYKQDREIYNRNGYYNTRNLTPRVGYVGDALYSINGAFAHFTIPNANQEKYVGFTDTISFIKKEEPVQVSFDGTPESAIDCLQKNQIILARIPTCSSCDKQVSYFNDQSENIPQIDCEQEPETCGEYGIYGYPTWINLKDNSSFPGIYTLENLVSEIGCE